MGKIWGCKPFRSAYAALVHSAPVSARELEPLLAGGGRSMTGSVPAVRIPPQSEIETETQREAFAHWLYWTQYELPTRAGEIARALHKADAYRLIRTRAAYAWRYLNHKYNWRVSLDHLMQVWEQWKLAREGK